MFDAIFAAKVAYKTFRLVKEYEDKKCEDKSIRDAVNEAALRYKARKNAALLEIADLTADDTHSYVIVDGNGKIIGKLR